MTLPYGAELRARIGYHLERSKELAEGRATDATGAPVLDTANIERSTSWHHGQAMVLATVYAAELAAGVEPPVVMAGLVAELGTTEVASHHWLPDAGDGPAEAAQRAS